MAERLECRQTQSRCIALKAKGTLIRANTGLALIQLALRAIVVRVDIETILADFARTRAH